MTSSCRFGPLAQREGPCLWAAFATGLLAGGASCAAVQGGLLAGVVARRGHEDGEASPEPAAGRHSPHCASCGLLIDDLVEELPGVAVSTTHVPSGRTVVACADGADLDPAAVAAAIAEAGFRPVPCHEPTAH